ncbi:bifunctional Gfo/Idh/MocA family oxidoreductase/class I SAM-dependent methyltransferase [Streptomyces sp. NPDC050610]|uniref:bifunctional Gfo/Idh/MocA family oxidoreductase/class I SAM-dependent methyltransferase n=1 Tax=Streptomyces sp. NPDC050610 TaxID=3157097 RepID=UPI003437A78B
MNHTDTTGTPAARTGRALRTVVCGTTFGQFYLAALAGLTDEFEIAGVLAAGSDRSLACARRHGVPLYRDVAELPDDIDLACVVLRSGVLGGSGTELAQRLLERGIHVVQEQPVHHDDLAACLRLARRHAVHYRFGNLYVRLPEVRRFTGAARRLAAHGPLAHIDAVCASQVVFPLLHILGEALGSPRPWRIRALDGGAGQTSSDGPFAVLTGSVGGTPLTLRVHNEVDPDDPDSHLHLLHRITLSAEGGSLTLTDPHGPVLFSPRLHVPKAVRDRFDFEAEGTGHLAEPSTTVLGPARPRDYRTLLRDQWTAAIGEDLGDLSATIRGTGGNARRNDQYHLSLARMWQDVTKELGYPVLRPGRTHRPLTAARLTAPAEERPAGSGTTRAGADTPAGGGPAPRPGERAGAPAGTASTGEPDAADLAVLVRAGADAADRHVGPVERDASETFVRLLDDAVLGSMLAALQQCGALRDQDGARSPEEILHTVGVAPRHRSLIRRWLGVLTAHGRITADGDLLRGTPPVDAETVARAWDAATDLWSRALGSRTFVDYLRSNADCLPRLMRDEQQAALLLFPEGRTDVADAVYRDTVTARWLNTAVAAVLRSLAARHGPDRPLRVVEVGAGTGATTDAVAAALAQDRPDTGTPAVDYLVTDVSYFFVAEAERRHTGRPFIRHGLYDIDRAPAEQGLTPGSADAVVAAGVLNNARDTDATLRHLADLLVPGGVLLATEPTREHLEIMASQAFMMTEAQDVRRASRTTFLSREHWTTALSGAGFAPVVTAPGEDHALAPLGQRLFAAVAPPRRT